MNKWEEFTIKDIVSGFYDGPHATPKEAKEGAIFLSIHNLKPSGGIDLSNPKYISMDDFPIWTKRVRPRSKDIVFSYEATLHRYAIIPENLLCCLGRRLALLRINEEKADYKFVYYILISSYWRSKIETRVITGATVDRIPLIDFPNFKIPLPPPPIQRRIADVLGRYDALIDNYQQQITALEAMAQELYREWFVRGRCPYARSRGEGELPVGWEKIRLSQIIDLKYGKSLTEENRRTGICPVVGSSGIIDYHDEALVLRPGIVVGRKGNVGSIFWIDKPFYPIDTAYYVESQVSYYFLYFNLQTQNFISGDAAVPGLNREQALSNTVILPDINSLERFDSIVEPTFRKKFNLQSQITTLRQTRDALLPRLLSGQVAVE